MIVIPVCFCVVLCVYQQVLWVLLLTVQEVITERHCWSVTQDSQKLELDRKIFLLLQSKIIVRIIHMLHIPVHLLTSLFHKTYSSSAVERGISVMDGVEDGCTDGIKDGVQP